MTDVRIILTLTDTCQGPPLDVRLTRALKVLLRTFGTKCIDVRHEKSRTERESLGASVRPGTEGTENPRGPKLTHAGGKAIATSEIGKTLAPAGPAEARS